MRDSIEFYVEFIGEVEKNPILYNHGLRDYSNRRMTETIWNNIGKKFNERGSDCKTKWKSIRSAYIRSLNVKFKKVPAEWPRKDYYLAPYLQFLNPFTKIRNSEGNNVSITQEDERQIEDSDHEYQTEEITNNIPDVIYADEDSLKHEGNTISYSVPSPSGSSAHSSNFPVQTHQPQKRVSEVDKSADDYFPPKKRKQDYRPEIHQREPCEMFLLSLVPHMTSMSQQQQLGFQRGVLDLIDKIKYSNVQLKREDPLDGTFFFSDRQ